MGSFSWQHWLIVLVVVLVLFGKGKVSDFMGDVAKGIKAFKKGMADDPETDKKDEKKEATEQPKRLEHQPVEANDAVVESEQKTGNKAD